MKKLNFLLTGLLLTASVFLAQQANAQAPQSMSYQSVIRNSSNALLANTQVGIKISVLQGSATGSEIFSETQAATTNANGLLSLQIGAGNAATGAIANINWANGLYFIKTEIDPTGGSNYSITGTQQLASVPYALYAAKSGGTAFETTAYPTDIHNTNPGNVGIGTDLPSEKLDVAGNLKVRGNISNGGSNASGPYSIATGLNTTASGQYSTAMGESSVSNGYSTTALGIASTASGWGATAIGILSSAEGSASVALGSRAKAYSLSEIAVGQFNTAYALNTPTSTYEFNGADRIFVVGNGQDDNNLSDAMVVLKNGNTTINGTTTANSFVKAGGSSSQFLMADGSVSEGILATIAAMQGQITALQNQLAALPQPVLSTVTIGSQIWTSTNLNVTTYRDGTPIPEVQDPTAWANLTTGAWCHLNNDPANDAIYGKMYNHYALEDPRGLAPVGYHVPTFAEYDTLIQTLPVGECNLDTWYNAFALMSTGFYNGTNTSGFSALNGGARSGDAIDFGMPEMSQPAGAFDSSYTGFWSSDPAGSYNYIYLAQQCSIGSTNRQSNYGAYVRLIKN